MFHLFINLLLSPTSLIFPTLYFSSSRLLFPILPSSVSISYLKYNDHYVIANVSLSLHLCVYIQQTIHVYTVNNLCVYTKQFVCIQ